MQLRLHSEEASMLEELSASLGVSKNQAVAILVRQEWEARQARHMTTELLD